MLLALELDVLLELDVAELSSLLDSAADELVAVDLLDELFR